MSYKDPLPEARANQAKIKTISARLEAAVRDYLTEGFDLIANTADKQGLLDALAAGAGQMFADFNDWKAFAESRGITGIPDIPEGRYSTHTSGTVIYNAPPPPPTPPE